jgi:hypothetical protein
MIPLELCLLLHEVECGSTADTRKSPKSQFAGIIVLQILFPYHWSPLPYPLQPLPLPIQDSAVI